MGDARFREMRSSRGRHPHARTEVRAADSDFHGGLDDLTYHADCGHLRQARGLFWSGRRGVRQFQRTNQWPARPRANSTAGSTTTPIVPTASTRGKAVGSRTAPKGLLIVVATVWNRIVFQSTAPHSEDEVMQPHFPSFPAAIMHPQRILIAAGAGCRKHQ